MEIAVGSTNPVKRRAVVRGTEPFERTIEAVDVASGVSEQPRSVAETVTGAENRARNALAATDAEYGIGLEGGVARLEGVPGLRLIMWAAVSDGDRIEHASGPSIRLPDRIVESLESGAELGPVLDEMFGETDVAKADGAVGVFTNGATTRADALSNAVACAFGPFVTLYYESGGSERTSSGR